MWWLKPFEILSSDFYGSKMWSKPRTCSKMAVFRCTVMRGCDLQGDHLSGNVREFDSSCQGSVRAFTMSQENFREKILSGKSCLKLFIVGLSCILASIQVFSRSLCCVKYYIYGWIMYRFIPTSPLIVTLVRAWYECWVPQTVREVHIVWSGEWSAWL